MLSFLNDSFLHSNYDMEEFPPLVFPWSPAELCASVVFVSLKSKHLVNGNATQVPNLETGEQVFRLKDACCPWNNGFVFDYTIWFLCIIFPTSLPWKFATYLITLAQYDCLFHHLLSGLVAQYHTVDVLMGWLYIFALTNQYY